MTDFKRYHVLATLADFESTELQLVCDNLANGKRHLLKRLKPDQVSPDHCLRLKDEYKLIAKYRLHCMLSPIRCMGDDLNAAILYHAVEGNTGDKLDITDLTKLLIISENLVDAVGEIHAAGLLHRNIQPAQILLDENHVYLPDFSQAISRTGVEHPDFASTRKLVQNLRYIAPEQTGRMNRPVDFRSDYYSLGAVLYQWFAGQPPFPIDDPLDLVYAQLATKPPRPEQWRPELPAFLADVILKLLEKDPDRRYQSIAGLKADLRIARECVPGRNIAPHKVGKFDIPEQISISHTLYGREHERQFLLDLYEKTCTGIREMLLVSGYSGIGKTSLIRETYLPVTRQKAFFVAGKFDLLQRTVPFSAWLDITQKLLTFVLAEPNEELHEWQQKLIQALGINGGVLIPVIPQLESVLGLQPIPSELPATEALNRFNRTFCQLIRAFCLPQRPLVIFLDDLQWIDSASLNLLELLASEHETQHLFLVGAYRDNEVGPAHPLQFAIDRLKRSSVFRLTEINLKPLISEDVERLIGDFFAIPINEARPLATVAFAKTEGNPFFLWQFLQLLKIKQLVYFDGSQMRWQWQLNDIKSLEHADNVVELMRLRFYELGEDTRNTLALAACLGNQFDISTLAALCDQPASEILHRLEPAQAQYFIASVAETSASTEASARFRFTHDRIQEVAYCAIPNDQLAPTHIRIARLLIARTTSKQLAALVFDIVDHLNLGIDLLNTRDEGLELARMNLMAARQAREAGAFEAALSYIRFAMHRLPDNLWKYEHALGHELYHLCGELEYLNGNFDQAQSRLEEAISQEGERLVKADLYHMLVVQYTLRAEYPNAIATARLGLKTLAVELPESDYETARDTELAAIRSLLGTRSLSCLGELPEMQDLEQRAVMKLLTAMGPPCYRSHPWLWAVIVAKEVHLCLTHGSVPSASYSFPAFGGLLTHVGLGSGQQCAELSTATLSLMERGNSPADTSVGYLMMGSSLRHWYAPLADATRDYQRAYQVGLDSGNLQYAVYAFGHNIYCRFFQGIALHELIRETEAYLAFDLKRKNQWGIDLSEGALRVFQGLSGQTTTADFSWRGSPESEYLQGCELHNNLQVLCLYFILKTEALLHLGQIEAAVVSHLEAMRRLDSVSTQGLFPVTQFYLHKALLLVDVPELLGLSKTQARSELRLIRQRFGVWSKDCPANFSPGHGLLLAEEALLDDDFRLTMEAYDQALDDSRRRELNHLTALIASRASTFWLGIGKPDFATPYLRQAFISYDNWQATTVLNGWLADNTKLALEVSQLSSHSELSGQVQNKQFLDLRGILQIAQAISAHVELDKLVAAILDTVTKLSGAQRIVLLLNHDNNLQIIADSKSDPYASGIRSIPIAEVQNLPKLILQSVARSCQPLRLSPESRGTDLLISQDPYFLSDLPRSICCLPLLYLGKLGGLLYLEHDDVEDAFGDDELLLEFIATQAAIAIQKSELFESLHRELDERIVREEQLHLLSTVVEQAPITLVITDIEVRITYVNPSFTEVTGYTLDEVRGENPRVLQSGLTPRTTYDELWASISNGHSWHGEFCNKRKNGEFFWEEIHITPVKNDAGITTHYVAIKQDISNRKQAEVALQMSEAKYRILYQSIRDGIGLVDQHGRFLECNQTLLTMSGYSLGEMQELTYQQLTPEEWHQSDEQALAQVQAQGYCEEYEKEFLRKDGKRIFISIKKWANGESSQMWSVMRDITERKRMENALRESEGWYRVIFEQSQLGIAAVTIDEWRFVFPNPAFCQMFGYTQQELRQLTVKDITHPDDFGAELKAGTTESGEAQNFVIQKRFITKAGKLLWGNVTASVLFGASGKPIFRVGMVENITARHNAEEELRLANIYNRSLIEASLDPLVTISPEGKITDVNQGSIKVTGVSREELIGTDFSNYFTEPEKAREGYLQVFAKGFVTDYPLTIRHRNGKPTDVLYNASLYKDAAGHVLGVFAAARDITKLKHIEAELAESESRLRTIINNEPECIKIVDTDGSLVLMNPAGLKMIEADNQKQVVGRSVFKLIAPEYRNAYTELHKRVLAGDAVQMEYEIIGLKGGRRWLESHAVPMQEANGNVVHLAVTRDITDRKHTQLILEQQASLLDLAHDAILTRNLDGTIMYWNQGAERAYGWSKSEALGQKSHVLLGTVFADTREVINEALLARGQWEGELTQTRRDGVQIFVASRQVLQFDEYGQPTTILEINRDFTGRKLAEDALRLSESRLNIALQKSLTGAWELNLKDNTAYHTLIHDSIFGYQTLLPKWTYEIFLDHVLPEDRHMVDQKFHEATATQTDWSFECRIRRIDGEIRWIYGTGGHVLNTQGKPDLLSGIIQDITDRKRAELALNQLNETLEQRVQEETEKNRQKEHLLIQQSRLAAMGEMIGNIAHQWRQPLNALTLVLANIEDAANHQELTPEYLENQTRNGERLIQKMSSTIDDFRHFFRPQKQAEPFSAIAAIEEARSLASASFHNNNIELRLEMREDVQIVGFANEFSQVLLNLLSNAKDAILSRHIQNGMVTIRLSRDELSAIIEVIDNGGGIPASAMEHIFEPYFSTKEMGTGIGLYMSKMIIETSMHGSILVRNVDSGAEFRIICPHISATVLRK